MINNNKVTIFDILDMFNAEVGYKGLSNAGKTTDERDDVVTRQTFNNWLREYNATHSRPIKGKKIDQYQNEWFRRDIEKLINDSKVQKKLKQAYLRKTVPLYSGYENLGQESKRVSKRYKEELNKKYNEGFGIAIKKRMEMLINEIINELFILKIKDDYIDVIHYIDKDKVIMEFIDLNKVEEEAFKMEDNYYGIPEYDKSGNIVAVHHQEERPKTDYFLK